MTDEQMATDHETAADMDLPIELVPEYNRLMTTNMKQWPDELWGYVQGRCAKDFCGAHMAQAVADWLKMDLERKVREGK